MNTLFLIPIGVLVFLGLYVVAVYNSLAGLKLKVKEAWSQIDVQLKRRTDLIPNLVETVKGYATHEKEVFENVTKARSALMSATGPKDSAAADNMLTQALKTVFAVAEAYPDLKASQNFLSLQNELSDVESKISYARQFYNSIILAFNTKIVTFPSSIVASLFGFTQAEFFEATDTERQAVKVAF